MFIDIKVSDLVNTHRTKVIYNEVLIYRRDIIKIPKLMKYFEERRIHVDESIRLDSLIMTQQNEIGLLFYEYYEYLIFKDEKTYLNEIPFKTMFNASEDILYLLKKCETLGDNITNGLDYKILSTSEFNRILINWFHSNYRNFRSVSKLIIPTDKLFDIDIEQGHFKKVTNKVDFLSAHFQRFISTQRGSIPFSNGFGASIKAQLQTKSTYFTKKSILEELQGFTETLTSIYEDDFELKDIEYNEYGGISIKIEIKITISINGNEEVKFKLENYKEI